MSTETELTDPTMPKPTTSKKAKAAKKVAAKKGGKKLSMGPKTGKKRSGKGSGARIREMIMEGKLTTEEMLAVIHKEFKDSKAKASDISWNRGQLKANPKGFNADGTKK